MKIETLAPYHLPHEEILLSIASSVIFKELELQDCPKLSLSEVIEQPQYGYTASASHEPVGVKFVRITDIQAGKIDWNSVPYCECEYPEKYLLRKNDILFARTGGTTGKSFIVKGDIPESIFASYLIRIRPKEGTISDFLYWFFQTKQYWSQIVTEKEGSAQPNVNGKKLSSLDIFVPERSIQKEIANYLNSYKSKVYGDLLELPSLPGILKGAEKKVARIESMMARIEVARRLRDETVEEAENILELFLRRIFLNNNQYDLVKLGDKNYFELNPSKSELAGLDEDIEVSFVPMTYVDPESGKIKNFDSRKLFEVRKGYTYFKEGDVLFAKITPCMENGNVAIAQNIINGIGFGTTEFHVVRVLEKVLPKWVYYLFRTKGFRDIAKGSMTGTAGQRRVPKSFLEQYEIPLPSLHEQRRIIAYLDSLQAKVDKLKKLQVETEKELEELVPSILDKAFKGEL